MNYNQKALTRIAATALGIMLSLSFVLIGGCSKTVPPAGEKNGTTKPQGETESGDTHHEDENRYGSVELTPDSLTTAGIEVQAVTADVPSDVLGATGLLELNGDRVSRVNPRVAGRCTNIGTSLGDRVRVGQTLAQIDSVEVDHVWSDYLKAKARLELAEKNVKREETLYEKKVSPEKDLLKARQELGEIEADMLLARERFRLLGVDVSQVEANTKGTAHNHPLIPVPAPLSGVVVEKSVTQGEMVNPEKTIFTIADLSTLWLMIDVYERDIGRIRNGMRIRLTVATYPEKQFTGRISYVGDIIEEKSRTLKVRVTIENGEGLLKPGMFASAAIDSTGNGRAGKVIVVPEETVFLDGSAKYVFLRQGDRTFAAREVLTGPAFGGKVEIKEGLRPGDVVVTKGVFALKSELKKAAIQDDHGH